MTRPMRFRNQYKPVGFGDPYDPNSVEGHRNAVRRQVEARNAREDLDALRVEAI